MRRLLTAILVVACSCTLGAAQAQDRTSCADARQATRAVAESYFAAYVALDRDALEAFAGPSISFADPTAELVFESIRHDGRADVKANFRSASASLTQMSFARERAVFAGAFAIFEGTLDWMLAIGEGEPMATHAMPFVVVLRVGDGKVVEHRDYADYTPLLAAPAHLETIDAHQRRDAITRLRAEAHVTVSDGLAYDVVTFFRDHQRVIFEQIRADRTTTLGLESRYAWTIRIARSRTSGENLV